MALRRHFDAFRVVECSLIATTKKFNDDSWPTFNETSSKRPVTLHHHDAYNIFTEQIDYLRSLPTVEYRIAPLGPARKQRQEQPRISLMSSPYQYVPEPTEHQDANEDQSFLDSSIDRDEMGLDDTLVAAQNCRVYKSGSDQRQDANDPQEVSAAGGQKKLYRHIQ